MKVYQILLIIILILAIILGIKIYNTNKKSEYSKKDIENILNKAYTVSNYKYISEEFELIRKDNMLKEYSKKSGLTVISDYDKKISYGFNDKNNIIIKKSISSNSNIRIPNTYLAPIDLVAQNSEFIKKEVIEGKETILLKYINSDTYLNIDIETGFPIRCKYKDDNDKNIVDNYIYEFNSVTDNDIKLPDFSNYQIIENK